MLGHTNEFSFVLKPSSIEHAGIGVFTTHGIKSGTKLVLNKEGGESRVLDASVIPETLLHFTIALPDGKRRAPKEFNHLWIVWYLNYSDTPNAELDKSEIMYYSIRDIGAGEEIVIDYNAFEEPEETKEEYYKR